MSDSSVTFDPMSAGSNPISRLLAQTFPTFFMRSRLVKVLVLLNQTSDQNLIQVLVTPESFSSGSPAGSPTITPRSALHGLKSDLIISGKYSWNPSLLEIIFLYINWMFESLL